ncbi:MAG: hypothetical protein U7126_13240 [Microcoleus sp.]
MGIVGLYHFGSFFILQHDRTHSPKKSIALFDLFQKSDRTFLRKRKKGRSPVALKNQPSLIYLEGGASFMQNVA